MNGKSGPDQPPPPTPSAKTEERARAPLLEVRGLALEFVTEEGRVLRAVDGVSFAIRASETVCLVGESGCGKSVTSLSIARLLPSPPARYAAGEILIHGRDVLRMPPKELRRVRGGVVSYIFQEPSASLNPVYRVGDQIKEGLRLHRPDSANDAEVVRLLKLVGISAPEQRRHDYPHQLSGGMQQRVMIAMALAAAPELLVADEPTTALDVTIQAQIIDLLRELQRRLGMSMLLITHNLGIVGDIADWVAVMYAGQILEWAPARELLKGNSQDKTSPSINRPAHPYTQALMHAVPELGRLRERLTAIPGNVPALGAFPTGCRFHPRCPKARSDCAQHLPELLEIAPGHLVRCPYWNVP